MGYPELGKSTLREDLKHLRKHGHHDAADQIEQMHTPGLSKSTLREDLIKLADSPDLFTRAGSSSEHVYVETWRILEVLARHPEVG